MHTMRWFYDDHFDRYHRGLSRYQAPMLDKSDLMCGEPDQVKSSFFGGSSSSSSSFSPSPEAFTLADRMKPTINQEDDVIILHVAERNHQTFSFERLFRSFHVALMDNVSSEYQFIEKFFSTHSSDDRKHLFSNIFSSTFQTALVSGVSSLA